MMTQNAQGLWEERKHLVVYDGRACPRPRPRRLVKPITDPALAPKQLKDASPPAVDFQQLKEESPPAVGFSPSPSPSLSSSWSPSPSISSSLSFTSTSSLDDDPSDAVANLASEGTEATAVELDANSSEEKDTDPEAAFNRVVGKWVRETRATRWTPAVRRSLSPVWGPEF